MNDLVFHSGMGLVPESPHFFHVVRGGPLENLWGGGRGRAKYKKIYSREGKLNEKNSYTPINPKKSSYYGLEKIHTRNLITKKIPAAQKFPTPPITFLMVRT